MRKLIWIAVLSFLFFGLGISYAQTQKKYSFFLAQTLLESRKLWGDDRGLNLTKFGFGYSVEIPIKEVGIETQFRLSSLLIQDNHDSPYEAFYLFKESQLQAPPRTKNTWGGSTGVVLYIKPKKIKGLINPFLLSGLGLSLFEKDVPENYTSKFNFDVSFGAGIEIPYKKIRLRFKLVFNHFSSLYLFPSDLNREINPEVNPGVDFWTGEVEIIIP